MICGVSPRTPLKGLFEKSPLRNPKTLYLKKQKFPFLLFVFLINSVYIDKKRVLWYDYYVVGFN